MDSFAINSCYAVLSAYSSNTPLRAFLELVIALVDEKKYTELDPQTMSVDFQKKYDFSLPYHPMQTVIRLGIDEKYFEYNSSLKKVYPIWSAINSEEFMKLLHQKDAEYNNILSDFDLFLQDKYSLHSSKEDLSDQIQAFIQRYGLISKIDKEILKKVKNDYHFAEYMLHCNDIQNYSALAYIDQYITGCSFAEVMTFSVPTSTYRNCKANVFLDTGFIFALLGIGSKDRSQSFEALFQDMIHLGMKPAIFQHTYSEIAGIIDNAIYWFGNTNYDPSLASETAYFFVTNNWSYHKATGLLGDLKRIITEDYQIRIDDTPYPHIGDIHTKFEADIKQMIIDEYVHNNPNFPIQEKEHTINQDARSLFMTLHYDSGYIAHTLPDVKNIFITTNRTLARVGSKLTNEIAHGTGLCIPISLTDLTWGTLIWANSPSQISLMNRANIISAAYAAFRPSEEILKKLNSSLIQHQENGDISPEKCYFLKTNALALRLLAGKTQNDETRYSDQMPFEILTQLRSEGYQEGLSEKQREVDKLEEEKEAAVFQLSLQKQLALIKSIEETKSGKEQLLNSEREKLHVLQQHILAITNNKKKSDKKIGHRLKIFKIVFAVSCIVCASIAWSLSHSDQYNWLITAIGAVFPFVGAFIFAWKNFEVSSINIFKIISQYISEKTYTEYGFSKDEYEKLQTEEKNLQAQISSLEKEINSISAELKKESMKVDKYSADIDIVKL